LYPPAYDAHPALQTELDAVAREYHRLQVATIAFFGLVTLANIGLVILIWRAFRDLQADNKS